MATTCPEPEEVELRSLLAAALRGEAAAWPEETSKGPCAAAIAKAARYHGVAGLLVAKLDCLPGWPADVIDELRQQALAEAMWELRHREAIAELLDVLASRGVSVLLLKGSALAYQLYAPPAARPRGDSDLLVEPGSVAVTRQVLKGLGYRPYGAGQAFEWLQQGWTLYCDGSQHSVDLHWAVFNSPALNEVLPTDECMANGQALPGFGPNARAMDPVRAMLHTCVHRALHRTAPYMSDGEAHFGGDRLIWSNDIRLLAGTFRPRDWEQFVLFARQRRVAGVCLEALDAATADLGMSVPAKVLSGLRAAAANDLPYLRSGRPIVRAWHDIRGMAGLGPKLRYLLSRLLSGEAMLRAKYPGMGQTPLFLLQLRRLAEAVRRRTTADQ